MKLFSADGRRGFAVRELLLMCLAIGLAVAGMFVMERTNQSTTPAEPVTASDVMIGHEVPLGDEFVCTVGVVRYASPHSTALPHYVSRVRFARRHPAEGGAFLFEIATGENANWHLTSGRAWTLMNLAETEAYLQEHRQRATQAPQLSAAERVQAVQHYKPPQVSAVYTLDESLRRRVPAEQWDRGLLVVTSDAGLAYLDQLQGFPLSRLAAAIRSAAERDHWTEAPSAALLPRSCGGQVVITDDEQRALARSLVRRLLAYLPHAGSLEDDAAFRNNKFPDE